ncbi:MAG: DUF6144 family protein [bacterium]
MPKRNDPQLDRREFMKLSTCLGSGALTAGLLGRVARADDPEAPEEAHLRMWINTLVERLDRGENCQDALLGCGEACALEHGLDEAAKKLRADLPADADVEDILALMRERHIGGDRLELDGNVITCTYDRCYCPIRKKGWVDSPAFCSCTKGWILTVFTACFQRPLEVELVQAIGRGDPVCRVRVTLG